MIRAGADIGLEPKQLLIILFSGAEITLCGRADG